MSYIGRLVNSPHELSQYGQVQDKFGNRWQVKKEELPSGAKTNQDLAYRLDFSDAAKQLPKLVFEK